MKKLTVFTLIVLLATFMCQAQKGNIPYEISHRAMPKGNNFAKIMPEKVGNFVRSKFKPPRPGFDGECVYSDGQTEILVLFGLAKDYNETQKTVRTMAMDAETQDLTENKQVFKKDPSYALMVNSKSSFFIWTRGFYYFSVESKSGKENLDRFMNAFPY
jgi:hypothetical protein